MQKLQFESSWDKAVSTQDRNLINDLFQCTKDKGDKPVACIIIRTAINYNHQMLITTLIHNNTSHLLNFQNREVVCYTSHGKIAQNFTIRALVIPPYTSMPWTFIFNDSEDFLFTELQGMEIKV